jgi:hypothetical protein
MKAPPSAWLAAFLLLACAAGGVLAARGLGDRGKEPSPEPLPAETFPGEPPPPAPLPAETSFADPPVPPGEIFTLRGRIRLVGNEPFTELVLSDEEGNDWFIEDPARNSLVHRQHEVLTLRGEAAYRDLLLASGRRMGVRKILRNITVVEEQQP